MDQSEPRSARTSTRGTLGWGMGILVLSVAQSGCGVFPQELRINDGSAAVPAVRVVHRFEGATRRSGIEAEFDQVRASGTQKLTDYTDARLAGQTIAVPADLLHSARVQTAHLAFNQHLFADRPVQLEWFAGLGYAATRWQTTGTAGTPAVALPVIARNTAWLGPMGGVTGRWAMSPAWALEARWWGHVERSLVGGNQQEGRELALVMSPAPALRVRLGLAQRTLQIDEGGLESTLTMKARGPLLALTVDLP